MKIKFWWVQTLVFVLGGIVMLEDFCFQEFVRVIGRRDVEGWDFECGGRMVARGKPEINAVSCDLGNTKSAIGRALGAETVLFPRILE